MSKQNLTAGQIGAISFKRHQDEVTALAEQLASDPAALGQACFILGVIAGAATTQASRDALIAKESRNINVVPDVE